MLSLKQHSHNKSVKVARKRHGLDASQKTLRTTYFKRYTYGKLLMEVRFITTLFNLKIPENLGRGDKIDNTTFITNDKKTITSLLNKRAIPIIGTMEANSISNSTTLIYANETLPKDVTPEQYLISKLYQVEIFLSSLWLYQDHSINDELGYLICTDNDSFSVTSNYLSNLYTTAKGDISCALISRDTLRKARNIYRNTMRLSDSPYKKPKIQLTKGGTRISRAMYHIIGARAESDISLKVASYCSAMESLFSTTQAELSHQLSERIAFFIEEHPDKRLEAFRKLKKAYGIRSKIVHGATIKEQDLNVILDSCAYCDNILRKIIKIILSSEDNLKLFLEKQGVIDEYFLGLIFGKNERLKEV